MIPKTIHYCWLSGDKKPRLILQCIDSWSKVMPDYTIKCWDSNTFDCSSVPFVRDAVAAKKYAFAADYIRLYALQTEGGIYLDSDVLIKRSFNDFLSNSFFCGTEAFWDNETLRYRMEAAIMGAEKGNSFIGQCILLYNNIQFDLNKIGEYIMPSVISKSAEKLGYVYENQEQHFSNLTVYPTSVFTNTLHPDSSNKLYAIHQNAGSWIDYSKRGWLFRFCKKYNYMNLYRLLEFASKKLHII